MLQNDAGGNVYMNEVSIAGLKTMQAVGCSTISDIDLNQDIPDIFDGILGLGFNSGSSPSIHGGAQPPVAVNGDFANSGV